MPGWHGFDVSGHLNRHFGVPVLADNDVNVTAIGEREAAWPYVENLLFVKVATQHLQIVQSASGFDAGMLDAGTLALHHALSPKSVDAMLAAQVM